MPGVKDLLARFEQKGENSPPENDGRGRSPGLSVGSVAGTPTPSQSPRPLSKVRTSFVAVEKDGRMGLRRDPSTESVPISSRRFSNDTEVKTPGSIPEKADISAESVAKASTPFKTDLARETIPESPRQVSTPKSDMQASELVPVPDPAKVMAEEAAHLELTRERPTVLDSSRGSESARNDGLSTTGSSSARAKVTPRPADKLAVSTTPRNNGSKGASKPLKSPIKSPIKSPLSSKAPPVAAKATPKGPGNGLEKSAAASVDKQDTSKLPLVSKAPAKKPSTLNLAPASTGFVRPKPKSPTRPVKLPSSLTTHTASSASKHGTAAAPPRQSLSRASGNVHRPASRATTSVTGATATTASTGSPSKTLKRQSSSINRPRPSLGLPPKQMAKDHPVAKKEADIDEGFLARMMRPTQSSSSKATDKAIVTPPRKSAAATHAARRVKTEDMKGSRKVASKITEPGKQSSRQQAAPRILEAAEAQSSMVHLPNEQPARDITPIAVNSQTAEEVLDAEDPSKKTLDVPIQGASVEEAKLKAEYPTKSVAEGEADRSNGHENESKAASHHKETERNDVMEDRQEQKPHIGTTAREGTEDVDQQGLPVITEGSTAADADGVVADQRDFLAEPDANAHMPRTPTLEISEGLAMTEKVDVDEADD